MSYQQLEEQISTKFGWVITLVLVAGSAFLLGRHYQPSVEVAGKQSTTTTVSSPQTANVIEDIQQTLAGNDPEASASTPAETPSQPETTGLININTATLAELDKLPGIGPTKAQAIINYRSQNGPFVRVEDLLNVKGIGPATLEKLRTQITI